jgi:ribose 5-phosphate isomerase B
MKKIFIASDHAGFELKNILKSFLSNQNYEVEDCGPLVFDPHDDYPDYVLPCAQKVAQNNGSFGIVVGLSGQGEAIAANRVLGVRAAVYYGGPEEILTLSRQHNNANVLSLGAKFIPPEEAKEAVLLWLGTDFSADERHVRRIGKIDGSVHNQGSYFDSI